MPVQGALGVQALEPIWLRQPPSHPGAAGLRGLRGRCRESVSVASPGL